MNLHHGNPSIKCNTQKKFLFKNVSTKEHKGIIIHSQDNTTSKFNQIHPEEISIKEALQFKQKDQTKLGLKPNLV